MARRHALSVEEVEEIAYGLKLRLMYHTKAKRDLELALVCYRTFFKLTHHESNRPAYPDWCKNLDLEDPEIVRIAWLKLELEAELSANKTW